MPLVSIIVPIYNAEKYLSTTLESLLTQSINDYEIICLNDGSTDKSADILEAYRQRYPNILIVRNLEKTGEMKARSIGIEMALGEYIGFCDSDDTVTPDMYQVLYSAAVQNGSDMVVCGFRRLDDAGHVYSIDMTNNGNKTIKVCDDYSRLAMMNPALWNKIFKASVLKENVEFINSIVPSPKLAADLIQFVATFPLLSTVTYIDNVLYNYFIRTGSVIRSVSIPNLDYAKSAMLKVRDALFVKAKNKDLKYLLDLTIFIHFGITFPFYMSQSKEKKLKEEANKSVKYLDENFSSWRTSPHLSFGYICKHNKRLLRPAIVRAFMICGLLPQFLFVYNFVLDTFKIDIKW